MASDFGCPQKTLQQAIDRIQKQPLLKQSTISGAATDQQG